MPTITLHELKILFSRAGNKLSEAESAVKSADAYDNFNVVIRHLSLILESVEALQFVLAQVQYFKQFNTPVEALNYLIEKVQFRITNLELELKYAGNNERARINELVIAYEKSIIATLLYAMQYSIIVINHDILLKALKSMSVIYNKVKYDDLFELKSSDITMLTFLLEMITKKINLINNIALKNVMFSFVIDHLDSIYFSGGPYLNFEKLLALFPEHKSELEQRKNALDTDLWNYFMTGITQGVKNRNDQKYPWAKLNCNRSISIFIGPIDQNKATEKKIADKFKSAAHQRDIGILLETAMAKVKFKEIDETKPLLEIIDHPEITEYRVNISPENLDDLFKSHVSLYSYRGEDNVLKLSKIFSLKEGVIRLCPVFTLDENSFVIRGAGCQLCEMPTVQLLHLLPDYDGIEKYFHWIPGEVAQKLQINRSVIESIFNLILKNYCKLDDQIYFTGSEGDIVISYPYRNSAGVKIVDLDENDKNFYILYGNTGAEELQFCKSLEISMDFYFKYIREILEKMQNMYSKNPTGEQEHIQDVKNALALIDKMIVIENNRAASRVSFKLPLTHTNFLANKPIATTTNKIEQCDPTSSSAIKPR